MQLQLFRKLFQLNGVVGAWDLARWYCHLPHKYKVPSSIAGTKKKSLNGILILGSSDRCKYTDTERVKRKLRHVGHWALKLPLRIEMTRAGLGGTRCSPDSPLRGDLLLFE